MDILFLYSSLERYSTFPCFVGTRREPLDNIVELQL